MQGAPIKSRGYLRITPFSLSCFLFGLLALFLTALAGVDDYWPAFEFASVKILFILPMSYRTGLKSAVRNMNGIIGTDMSAFYVCHQIDCNLVGLLL